MELREAREWMQFAIVAVGGGIGLLAFLQNLKQRRVENALKFLALFRDGLKPADLAHWEVLFRSSSEPAGASPGKYFNASRKEYAAIGDYYSEGSEDGQAISRMTQSLDVVCHQVITGAADPRTVFYEIGQLLGFFHLHLSAVPSVVEGKSLLALAFPSIDQFFRRYGKAARKWPTRVYAYVE